MVWYFAPSSLEKNLGKAYNDYANLIQNDNDWLCFQDRDVFFPNHEYANIIDEVVKDGKNNNVGLFTCLTNRVGNRIQCHNNTISEDRDIGNHYEIAKMMAHRHRHRLTYTNFVISGHVMIIQKRLWNKIGGAKDGLLGVDNDISRKVLAQNKKIAILNGVYCFHYYRLNTGIQDKKHLV